MLEPVVNYDVVVNRSEQSRQNTAEKIAKFLKGTGLKLSEGNIAKYFSSRVREPVSNRTVSEMYYRIKEDKRLNRDLEKNVDKTLKTILKGEPKRTRVVGKSKYRHEN